MKNIRKISFAKDDAKKEKRRNMWLTLLMVGIMALSTAGFALNFASTETKRYGRFKFEMTNSGWKSPDLSFTTTYLPQDVENISSTGTFKASDLGNKAYVISESYMAASIRDLLYALPLQNSQRACLPENENETSCSDLPLKGCEDADAYNAILIFKESNETSISYGGYCLQISGSEDNLLKAADKAAFIANGVIKA